jgi:predicted CXXCH cytochrome family protein
MGPRRNGIGRLTVLGTAISFSLLIAAANSPTADRGIRILYPSPNSAHVGLIRIIIAADKSMASIPATLDEQPLSLKRMDFDESWQLPGRLKATSQAIGNRAETAIWTAGVALTTGTHRLMAGGQSVDIRAEKNRAAKMTEGLSRCWDHIMLVSQGSPTDCDACHEVNGTRLGTASTPKVCSPCHSETNVQLIHGHVPGPLSKCAQCHDPHGASRSKLLVDTKEKLCSKCHSAGHFRG